MTTRALWMLLALLLAGSPGGFAAAQAEGEDDAAEGELEDEAAGEEGFDEAEWQLPRVLLVRGPRTPVSLTRQVADTLEGIAEVVSGRGFVRRARQAGLRPTSSTAYERLLEEENVALVLEVRRTRFRYIPQAQLTYREGALGAVLLVEQHPLSGRRLRDRERERVRAELRLALAVTTRPRGGPAEMPVQETPDDPDEPGAVVEVSIAAGGGMGTRAFTLPTGAGEVRLGTTPYPAARVDLALGVRPSASGRLRVAGRLTYATSVGLRTTDRRVDGSERETASRSQRLDAGLDLRVRLGAEAPALGLLVEVGWMLRHFGSEAPVTLPDYGLSGPRLALGLELPLFDDRVAIAVAPAVQLIVSVGDGLRSQGVDALGVGYGGEARLRVKLVDSVALRVAYRESHARLSGREGDVEDVMRGVMLQAIYTP